MYANFSEFQDQLLNGNTSCSKTVEFYLKTIESKKHLNAFLETFDETALQKAKEIDEKIAQGNAGRLAGFVIGIKDNICYKGHKVSSSSQILDGFESLFQQQL